MFNLSTLLGALPALLLNAGTIEDDITTVVTKFQAVLAAVETALPSLKTFATTLEGDAQAQFAGVISAVEGLVGAAKTTASNTVTTVNAVTAAATSAPVAATPAS